MVNVCNLCGGELPPLNGVEENDFAELCEFCEDEKLLASYDDDYHWEKCEQLNLIAGEVIDG